MVDKIKIKKFDKVEEVQHDVPARDPSAYYLAGRNLASQFGTR